MQKSLRCVVVDAFFRFIQVYAVKSTSASDTIKALEKFFTYINQEYHRLLRASSLKVAPEKTKFLFRKVQFLGQVVSQDSIQPVAKKISCPQNFEVSREQKRCYACFRLFQILR